MKKNHVDDDVKRKDPWGDPVGMRLTNRCSIQFNEMSRIGLWEREPAVHVINVNFVPVLREKLH